MPDGKNGKNEVVLKSKIKGELPCNGNTGQLEFLSRRVMSLENKNQEILKKLENLEKKFST